MPISKRAFAALFFVVLSACDAGLNVTRKAPEAVALPDGLVIAGARGWCVDSASTQTRNDATTVVFGSCAAIAQNALLPRPPVRGVVTVSVEEAANGTPPAEMLEAFLITDQGRSALARDGQATSVDILETRADDNTLILHAVDRSGWPVNAAEDYWRAVFDIEGRFVTVSLVGLSREPIGRADSIAALEAQIDRLRNANAN